ncbi:MAG: Crp/Fnr family transcriptional regulator, partial [Saprospiraceae bacterium]|nr:Crp/Fnr family transcriptional regulator [Saprospiraceae bacterium]
MQADAFKQFIENYTALSQEDWVQIARCFEKRTVAKDEILLQEGSICRHLYFI